MKAVFVIDVDENELGKAYATITANDITFFAEGVIRPLPKKHTAHNHNYHIDEEEYLGWNDCIDAITGDAE